MINVEWRIPLLLLYLIIQTLVSCVPIHKNEKHSHSKHVLKQHKEHKKAKDLNIQAKHLRKSIKNAYKHWNLKEFSTQALTNLEGKFQTIKELGTIINCQLHSPDFVMDGNRVICNGRQYYISPEVEVDAIDIGSRRQGIFTPNGDSQEALQGTFSKGIYGKPLASFLGDPGETPYSGKEVSPHRNYPEMGIYDPGLREIDTVLTHGHNSPVPIPKGGYLPAGMDGQVPSTPQESGLQHGIGDDNPTLGPGLGGEAARDRGGDLESIPDPLNEDVHFVGRSSGRHESAAGSDSNFDGGYISGKQNQPVFENTQMMDPHNIWAKLENGFYGTTSSQLGIRDPTMNSDSGNYNNPGYNVRANTGAGIKARANAGAGADSWKKSGIHSKSKPKHSLVKIKPTKRSAVGLSLPKKDKHKVHKNKKPKAAASLTVKGEKRFFSMGSMLPQMTETRTPSASGNPDPGVSGFTRYGPFLYNFGPGFDQKSEPVLFPYGSRKHAQSRAYSVPLPELSMANIGLSGYNPSLQYNGDSRASVPSTQYAFPFLNRGDMETEGHSAQQYTNRKIKEDDQSQADDADSRGGVPAIQYGIQPGRPPPFMHTSPYHPFRHTPGREMRGYMSVPIVQAVPIGYPMQNRYNEMSEQSDMEHLQQLRMPDMEQMQQMHMPDMMEQMHMNDVEHTQQPFLKRDEFVYGRPDKKEEDANSDFESMSTNQPVLPSHMYRDPRYDPHESETFYPNGIPGREDRDKSEAGELTDDKNNNHQPYEQHIGRAVEEDSSEIQSYNNMNPQGEQHTQPIGKAEVEDNSNDSNQIPQAEYEARMLMNKGPNEDMVEPVDDHEGPEESETGSKRDKPEIPRERTFERKQDGRIIFTKEHVGFGPITVTAKTAKSAMKDPGDDNDEDDDDK